MHASETLSHEEAVPPDWERRGETLVRELDFRDFESALRFVEYIAGRAVDYGRRPDMCISDFNRVKLTIVNPHRVGLTPAELRLAEKVSAVIDEQPPDGLTRR